MSNKELKRDIQELQYNIKTLASIVADLTCMVDARPSTLDTEGQDWFENKLKLYHANAMNILNS